MQKLKFIKVSSLISTLALSACSLGFHPATEPLAKQIADGVGCPTLKATIWTELYKSAETTNGFPTREELQVAIEKKLRARFASSAKDDLAAEFSRTIATAY